MARAPARNALPPIQTITAAIMAMPSIVPAISHSGGSEGIRAGIRKGVNRGTQLSTFTKGMSGVRMAGHLLLEGLKGHTAFKTPEQQERHRIKYGTKPVDVGEP